jgi:hypothetical protein
VLPTPRRHEAPALTTAPNAPRTAYATILAENYLAKALALRESLQRHEPGAELEILLIDARTDDDLPAVPGARLRSLASLGLSEREVLDLAMGYDLVELATAVKPLLLQQLLTTNDRAMYLDPDLYITAPMVELGPALDASEGGILLTPHFLEPSTGADFSEGHLLHVGVYNLGFCAVDRRAMGFLHWWWGHLATECLHDPFNGLFVDQKWMDVGSVLFRAAALRHYGYNVSVANLHERPVGIDDNGFVITSTGDRLRVFHFHAFSTDHPELLSMRQHGAFTGKAELSPALDALRAEYAKAVLANQGRLAAAPSYRFGSDVSGRHITRRLRRAHRTGVAAGVNPPSPFLPQESAAYAAWRHAAWRPVSRQWIGDAAKSVRYALPEEYERLKAAAPALAKLVRRRYVEDTGFWG